MNRVRLKANLLLFLVAVIWGTAFIAQGIAGRHGIAYLYNGVCFLLAGLILIPLIPRRKKITKDQWKWMWIAGAILFAATAMQQVGLLYTKVANASFLTSLYSVFTPFLLWIGFREQPHKLDLIAVATAGVGAFFLSTGGKFEAQPGDSIELAGAIFWALHFVVIGKYATQFDSISFASGHFMVCGLINLLIGLFIEDVSVLKETPVMGAVLYRAVFSVGIGYTLQVWGQKHAPPTDAALILGLEAVFAAIAGWVALHQGLSPTQIVGCAAIFIAALISQLKGGLFLPLNRPKFPGIR